MSPIRQFSRGTAIGVLALLVLAIAALTAASFLGGPEPVGAVTAQNGDLALYGRIVDRLRLGESYYRVAHAELLQGHYPTLSVFNWRMPLLLTLVNLAPATAWAQGALAALAITFAALGLHVVNRQGNWILAGTTVPLLIVSLAPALVPGTVYFGEIVAGILILGSCLCYAMKWWLAGILLALLALFVRELAAPYVVLCLALAAAQGRRGEVWLGLAGLVAFGACYLLHVGAVEAQLGPNEIGDPEGWVRFGGLPFVVRTAAFDGLLMLAPVWVSAALLPLAFLGLLAFPRGGRMAAVVLVYTLLFSVVGKPFDTYWGAIYTPLLAFGVAWAPLAIRDLLRVAAPDGWRFLPSDGADGL